MRFLFIIMFLTGLQSHALVNDANLISAECESLENKWIESRTILVKCSVTNRSERPLIINGFKITKCKVLGDAWKEPLFKMKTRSFTLNCELPKQDHFYYDFKIDFKNYGTLQFKPITGDVYKFSNCP